jgi:trk system potassium uptake protein TrkA
MQVVIVGAGNVGYTLARTLCKQHSVMMIEQDEKRFERIVESLDIGALNANGASPKVLRNIINGKTKLFLAVTESDELNIFACQVAKQVQPGLCTIARVRNQDYLGEELRSDLMNVDHTFSPEQLTATKMTRIATTENLIDYEALPSLGVDLATFRIKAAHESVFRKPIAYVPMPANSKLVAIHRDGEVRMPKGTEVLREGDEVTIIGPPEAVEEFNTTLGTTRSPRDFIIVGGGILAEHLLTLLDGEGHSIKLIERDEARCRQLSRKFDHMVIINDNGSDPSVLRNENVNMADALICTSDSEDENLLACLIGKHLGVPKTLTKYSRREYERIFTMNGVDSSIGYYHLVANEIVKQTVPELEVFLLLEGFKEQFFGLTITERCKYSGCTIPEVDLPDRSIVAMVVRDGVAAVPGDDTVLKERDVVLIYASLQDISRLERMFHTHIPVGV